MPLNQIKTYNQHLDLSGLNPQQRGTSLKAIFDRDFTNKQPIMFNNKTVIPCPLNGAIEMDTLFAHLTTVIVDKKINRRDFDIQRSKRLHWVRFHIDLKKTSNMLVFTVKEPSGLRTYLYDDDEKYVIVFEPRVKANIYFLLTAYHLEGKDAQRDKIKRKYARRIAEPI
jgi:hypothetical protein